MIMNNTKSITFRQRSVSQLLILALMLTSTQSYAEYFGQLSGRSADISSAPSKSIEAGFLTGDIADVSYQSFGARFNFRVSSLAMIYLDAAQVDIEDADGQFFGVGFLYELEGVLGETDLAVKAAFHDGDVEQGGFTTDGDVLSVEALFSGKQLGSSKFSWYANAGFHQFDFDGFDDTEIGVGGGVFLPTSFGEFYAGADHIDELTFGLGIRYFFQ